MPSFIATYITSIDIDFIIKIVLALLVGYLIGLERESKGKPAGIKTYALISLGATVFTHISISIQGIADPSRVAAQIVSGLGFIGAGAIFQSKRIITGLTTAASMWVVGALGTLIGLTYYSEAIISLVVIFLYFFISKLTHSTIAKKQRFNLEIGLQQRSAIADIKTILKKHQCKNIKISWEN